MVNVLVLWIPLNPGTKNQPSTTIQVQRTIPHIPRTKYGNITTTLQCFVSCFRLEQNCHKTFSSPLGIHFLGREERFTFVTLTFSTTNQSSMGRESFVVVSDSGLVEPARRFVERSGFAKETLKRCGALVVSTSPVDGLKEFLKNKERADFFTTDEGNLAKKATPFFRLWCIVELVAAIVLLVYSPLKTASKSSQPFSVKEH